MNMFFLLSKEKAAEIHTVQKCSMLLRSQSLSHCVSNVSPHCLQKKSVSCMVALMSHFPMKEQDLVHFSLFRFFSLYVLSFTMIFFLFNWLVSSSFFSYGSSLIWKENATWFSLAFLLFHLPLCTSSALIYLSLSFDASLTPSLDYLLFS